MNKVILMGNLVAAPEKRVTQSGISTANFRLAVRRDFKNGQTGQYDTDFITCVAWRKTADYVAQYGAKGERTLVSGSIQTRAYDAQDGTRKYVTEIIVDRVEFIGTRARDAAPDAQEAAPEARGSAGGGMEVPPMSEVDDDDLPF